MKAAQTGFAIGLSIAAGMLVAASSHADDAIHTLAQNVEPSYTPPTPAPPASPVFVLKEVRFGESALLEKAELDAIAAQFIGRELGLRDLQQMVGQVNALYQRKGMLTARALLPPQKIDSGLVIVQLVEGKLGAVSVTGNAYTKDEYILKRLPLEQGSVINGARLDRDLKWFNRTNDMSLNASLKPGSTYGQSDVDLQVDEPKKYIARIFVDNEGVDSTGRNEAGVALQDNNLLGRGDSFNFYGTHSSGADNGSISYKIPVTRQGGTLSAAYSRNTTAINAGPLEALDVTAASTTALASYMQPWIATERWYVNTPVTYTRTHSETRISGIPLSEFDVNKGSIGISVDVRDPAYRAALSQTFSALNAEDTFGNKVTRSVFAGAASAVVRINDDYYGVGRAGWQYSPDEDLPPSDLFQIGGPGTVRGHAQGFVAGKDGYYAGVELHRSLREWLNAFVFYDMGEVKTTNFPGQSIQGTGVGGVITWKKLTIELTAGFALHKIQPDQDGSRYDVRVEYAF